MKRSLFVSLASVAFLTAGQFALPSSSADSLKKEKKVVTFNKDVAPIFFKSCAECHRTGEAAPMSLMSYKDARPWAKSIREKVLSREMPPWHADPHVGEWANDRRLTQAEVEAIVAWVDGGAQEGNPKDLPSAPQFAEGWNIGKPDVVIQIPEEYTLDANGPDEYQYFDVPTGFTEDKYVQMAEARPGNRKVVHHVIAFIVPPGNPSLAKVPKEMKDKMVEMSLKTTPFYRDGFLIRTKTDQPVYNDGNEIPLNLRGFNNVDDFLTAYAPGSNYGIWKPGIVKKIPAGATIRFQIHYSKVAGSVQKDRSMVGLVFAKDPPARLIRTRAVSNVFFQIPPNSERHQVTGVWTPKTDVTVYSLMPHMHYRGAAMEYKVTYPDGRSEVLLSVPNYSFAWQTSYFPKAPVRIPAGSKIVVTGYFDNSAKNKFNPDPTKSVRHGEPTYDEMMMGFMDYVAEKPATLAKVEPKIFDAYVGQYDMGNNRIYTVTRDGNRFFVQAPGNPRRELFPESEVKFFVPETEVRITFIKNDKGEVVEILFEQNDRAAHWKKIKDVSAGVGQR